jgi:hypothetical protein
MTRPRAGFTVAELLAALTIGALIMAVLGGVLLVQLRMAAHAADRARSADALRTASAVIEGELRRSAPGDLRAAGPDSLALRSFRGLGVVCAAAGEHLLVRYRGDRLPDARKDSVLIIAAAGTETVSALRDVRTTTLPCPLQHGETGARVRTAAPAPPDAVAVLIFESGTYFLAAGALRYRLGAAGRQPLTGELFLPDTTPFIPLPDGVRYRLRTARGDSVHRVGRTLRP